MKLSIKNVSKYAIQYAIQRLFNVLSRHIKYADKKYYMYWQEISNVLTTDMKCTDKEFQVFYQ